MKTQINKEIGEQIIKYYTIDKIGYKKIAEALQIPRRQIKQFLIDSNIKIKYQSLILVPSQKMQKEVIRLYTEERKSEREIGEILSIGPKRTRKILNKNKIKRRGVGGKWELDSNDSDTILAMYDNYMSVEEIRNYFGVSKNPIVKILRDNKRKIRHNNSYRHFNLNENYFKKINTPDVAYWLGWLMADGYNDQIRKRIQFHIHNNDIKIIERFKDSLNSEHKIVYGKKTKIVGISISNKKLSNDLAKLGCVQAKSLILKWPKGLPKHLIPYFIRGYFEGDGCISGHARKDRKDLYNYCFGIISSCKFIKSLQRIIKQEIGLELKFHYINKKRNSILASHGYNKVVTLMSWLYKDRLDLRLDRKYDRFQQMLYSKNVPFVKYKDAM